MSNGQSGSLVGQGSTVIVSVDVSILPQSMFVRGGATGVAFKEEVHPQLLSFDATMHERTTGKVGMYTRFFDYANYRIPFSNFFVSVLTHFRIPFSQLTVFRSAKVDEFVVPANARFEMDLNAFIQTTNPRKVRNVDRARTEDERPIVTMAKHRTVTLLPTSVPRPSGELSASIKMEFVEDAGGSGGGDQEFTSVGGYGNVEPFMPTTDNIVAKTEASGPKRSKKKRVTRRSESTPAASYPPKRFRADYGTTGGFAGGGKSPSVLNRLLHASRLMVEQGVLALPTLPFITSSVTASPLEEGEDHTNLVTGPSLRTVGPSARFVVLSDSSHHSGAKSADPEIDSFVRSVAPVMTTTTTITAFVSNAATTTATPIDVGKDKDVLTPSIFAGSSSSDKADHTLSLFRGRLGIDFVASSIRAGGDADVDLQEIYVPEWSMTKGFELNDGRSCANMIDHFTPPALFKIVREMEHEQLFVEFNVSAAHNLSLSSEVRMRAEYNILEKRKWKFLAEEKNNLMQVKDKEIKELRSQLLQAKGEFIEVAQLRTRVSSFEAIDGSLRGEIASAKEHNSLLEQERSALKLKVTGLESIIVEKDRELSDLGTSSSSLRLAEIDADFPRSKKDASTRDVIDLFRLDDVVAEVLGMTDLQPDVGQLMVLVHHKQDKVVIGSQALSVALETCHSRVRKMVRNLAERLPFLKDVFVSIDHPISTEALAILPETSTEPSVNALITTALSTMVIHPNSNPFLLVEDYENLDLAGAVPEDVILGPEGEGKVGGSI
ncbi:hypothetical protein Tco_1107827 [Tanacetum coccineum]